MIGLLWILPFAGNSLGNKCMPENSLMRHGKRKILGVLRLVLGRPKKILRFAQDFACGLPLRSRPQNGSSSLVLAKDDRLKNSRNYLRQLAKTKINKYLEKNAINDLESDNLSSRLPDTRKIVSASVYLKQTVPPCGLHPGRLVVYVHTLGG